MTHEPECYRFHEIEAAMGDALIPVKEYQDAVLYVHDHETDADDEITPEYDDRRDFITDADYEILKHDDNLSMRDIASYKRLVIFCNRQQQQKGTQ